MNAQDVILGSRVAHVRELKAEIERLRRENAALHDQNAALGAHFDLALLAAEEFVVYPESFLRFLFDMRSTFGFPC
jgi:hypothetical protein